MVEKGVGDGVSHVLTETLEVAHTHHNFGGYF